MRHRKRKIDIENIVFEFPSKSVDTYVCKFSNKNLFFSKVALQQFKLNLKTEILRKF